MKNDKGIVLIALIVTIVVAIILLKATLKETDDSEILEYADKANVATEGQTILEYFIEAQAPDENGEYNILETAQNFVKNNEKSEVKYKVKPDPFTNSNYYLDKSSVIVYVEGQVNIYKYFLTNTSVSYDGIGDKTEIELMDFAF